MAENSPLPHVLQLVLDLPGRLAHLPSLFFNGVAEVAIDFNNSFHDKLALSDDVYSLSIHSNIIYCGSLDNLQIFRHIVEVDEIHTIPILEKGNFS